jgi:hypothetical protein
LHPLSALTRELCARVDLDIQVSVIQQCAQIVRDPAAIRTIFPAVGRLLPPGPLDADADPADPFEWTIQDAVRVQLLNACGDAAPQEAVELYRFGDASERRGVLRALDVLPFGATGVSLVEDALRSNDTRLIAAALGPFGARVLDDQAFRQAVLKCVFVGLPVAGVAGLDRRADAELARMLAAFAHERVAAGRTVPGDIWPLIDRYPPAAELAAIQAERTSPHPDRRAAAVAALAALTARREFA